jgi:predicted DNA binding CopG/RHH family protein
MVTATELLKTRVTPHTKRIIKAVAQRQQLTESAWLRRLIEVTLQTSGANRSDEIDREQIRVRSTRLTIRLVAEDQLLLKARASARGMAAATYVSVLVRAHLRDLSPLPKQELMVLRRSVTELGAMGRNLNQIARAANRGGQVIGPTRDDLLAVLRACMGLRDHVAALMQANLATWETGHAEARG